MLISDILTSAGYRSVNKHRLYLHNRSTRDNVSAGSGEGAIKRETDTGEFQLS
jgi:hypothetical protein